MSAEQREWVVPPAVIHQQQARVAEQPPPSDQDEAKAAPDEALLLGMMLWLEQGLVLELPTKKSEEELKQANRKANRAYDDGSKDER